MKHLYTAFLALLIVGSAGLAAKPALAGGYRYDAECNCNVPIHSKRVVREAPRVNVHTRVVNTRKVVPRYRNVEENQLVVHVRPVINKEVVVHRQHIHYQNIITKRVNTLNRFREEVVNGGTSNRYQTTTSSSTVVRVVPGRNCNCAGEERVAIGPRDVSYRY
ncbi:MAG TPA: hypothetical protein VFG44_02325 [Burkholderiales bacterium]|nr:hypothetical protein [Burkholderiales bacterium]